MIEKCYGGFTLSCDICNEAPMNLFLEFMDAVDYKKQNGWKSQKRNNEWEDVCPECQEGEL